MDEPMMNRENGLVKPSPSSAKTDPKKVRKALMKMVAGAGAVALLTTAMNCMGEPPQSSLHKARPQPATRNVAVPGGLVQARITPTPKPTPAPKSDMGEDK